MTGGDEVGVVAVVVGVGVAAVAVVWRCRMRRENGWGMVVRGGWLRGLAAVAGRAGELAGRMLLAAAVNEPVGIGNSAWLRGTVGVPQLSNWPSALVCARLLAAAADSAARMAAAGVRAKPCLTPSVGPDDEFVVRAD